MKKILLALFLLIASSYGFAQNTVTVSGTFTDNGQPRARELVYVYYHSLDSNTSHLYADSVFTDSSGYYQVSKNLPIIVSQGYVRVYTSDCNNSLQTKLDYFNPTRNNIVLDFTCPTAGCANYFYYAMDTANGSNFNVYFQSGNNFGPNTTYSWSFGDGGTGVGLYASHVYTQPGVYPVCLTTTNTMTNCTNVYCDSITVSNFNFSCYVSFSGYSSIVDLSVAFTGYTKGSPNATLYWDFGDNTTGVGNSIVHTYASAGMYNVCVTLVDSVNNCMSSYCNLVQAGIVLVDPCSAEFKMFMLPDSIQPGASTVYFSLVTNNPGANGYWSFGDGNTGVGQTIVHSYAAPGTYNIMVVVIDTSFFCTDTVYKQVLIDGGTMKILGVDGAQKSFELNSIFPNPVADQLNVSIRSEETQELVVRVLDLMGRVLVSTQNKTSIGNNLVEIPTHTLNSGMYIVEIISSKGKSASKFIKN